MCVQDERNLWLVFELLISRNFRKFSKEKKLYQNPDLQSPKSQLIKKVDKSSFQIKMRENFITLLFLLLNSQSDDKLSDNFSDDKACLSSVFAKLIYNGF